LVVGLAVTAWVPIFELCRVAISSWRSVSSNSDGKATAGVWMAGVRQLVEPPVWQLILNSLKLSLCAVPMVAVGAWLARVFGANRKRDRSESGVPMTPLSVLPPMVQGVAILCLPGLLQLAVGAIPDVRPGGPLSEQLRAVSGEIDLERNPWVWLVAAVVVVVGQPFWMGAGGRAGATTRESRTGWDAALLIGSSRRRAAGLCRPRRSARDAGWLIAVGLVVLTNVTPSILFSGLPGCWTLSVGVIELFDASGNGRGQAAALAMLGVGINLAAVGLFRMTGQDVDRQVGARP
jgi:hypothetical protein